MILSSWKIKEVNSGVCFSPENWYKTENTPLLLSHNPSTGQLLSSVQTGSLQELEKLIDSSHRAFLEWRHVPAPKRGEVVRKIADSLRQKKQDLAELITAEMGKPIQESLGEVQEMIDMADFAVGQSRMLYGNSMPSERPEHRLFEQWHPLGIVGVITAFNFPVAVWAWNAFIAAICGNVVIWKPSSKVPLCAIAVQKLCNQVLSECGYAGVFNLFISNDRKLAERFVCDSRVPLISFTGSTEVGRQVNQWVAAKLGRCLLELGGNNALIVDREANIDLAVMATLFGAIGTAGQRCTTTRRLLLDEKIYDTFLKKLLVAYREIRVGDPRNSENHMGPLVDDKAVEHYRAVLKTIKTQGGIVLFGGEVLPGAGYFVEPTLVVMETDSPLLQAETFLPILYVVKYKNYQEALRIQNDTVYGLSSALFTNNLRHAERFLSVGGSDCGLANINAGTSGAEIGGAFGGEKSTGGGREAGSDAWKAYMRRQTCVINWGEKLPLSQGINFNNG